MSLTAQHHFLAGKRIIICGGGIGGTVFCIALQQFLNKHGQNIQPRPRIDLYERETSADAIGREGYSLSIRDDGMSTGLQTLQKLGILDEMIAESNSGTHFTLFIGGNKEIGIIHRRSSSNIDAYCTFKTPPDPSKTHAFLRYDALELWCHICS